MQYQHRASSSSSCTCHGHIQAAIVVFVICGLHFVNGREHTLDEIIQDATTSDAGLMGGEPDDIIELDIKLTPDELASRREGNQLTRFKRAGRIATEYRWPDKTVPYEITSDFDATQAALIVGAMAEWEDVTCIQFVPHTSQTNYVKFIAEDGCWSFVGRIDYMTTGQNISYGSGCIDQSVMVHEMGHALGLYHEQSRPDRDSFVTINFDNVVPDKESNFQKKDETDVSNYGTPYDYTSVMHYGRYFFSTDPGNLDTIIPTDPSFLDIIGHSVSRSYLDVKMMNIMYECNADCSSNPCSATQYQGADCECHCSGSTPTAIENCPPSDKWGIMCFIARFLKFLCRISFVASNCATTCG